MNRAQRRFFWKNKSIRELAKVSPKEKFGSRRIREISSDRFFEVFFRPAYNHSNNLDRRVARGLSQMANVLSRA